MKKLSGMKKNFSSENKKLNREELKSLNGGYSIKSNLVNSEGCGETDYYSGPNGTGDYKGRAWLCTGPAKPTDSY
ncbi:TIGR04139 family peptide modification target [Chryseobacterium sp. MEBOG06]|uniref:TIGR04139 family peptide modification target n=1 Tax=Chryseobacterium sp. MEBOG06 TaxID=2879938 RepID=UPI001F409BDF|nr:TIGR04139 family peptide modification target [Chryseobacterium sp. MEBOG06]UKB84601.1 TIGR04139 family peptide modification target [Chryseobacterium sp. MEBOG06]